MEAKIERLIISYLEGTISLEDEKILLKWFKSNPQSVKEFSDFQRIWNITEITAKLNDETIKQEWKLLKQKVSNSEKPVNKFLYWLPRVAAVFLLGAIFSFAISYQIYNPKNSEIVYHEINTPAGAKSKVTLPDGTIIWLNASSNLKYSNQFNKKNREVYLTGEAYFDVETNPSKVFLVRTTELNIKAYGTTFNVKSYPEEGTIETTLIEGSIGITRTTFENKKNDEVILEPNQRVVYYRRNKAVEKENIIDDNNSELDEEAEPNAKPEQKLTYLISKGIKAKDFTSWKDGTLFITSETLKELAIKLERKYDVKIHFVDEKIENLKFTGSIQNETIEQVIEAIGIAANIKYRIKDRDVWLKEIE
jgi:ferric-dicitrate binding protein FerR (iron transport regulator)